MSTTQVTGSRPPVPGRVTAPSVTSRQLLAFFGLVFGLSWMFWLVALFAADGTVATIAEYGALFGPAAAALIVAWRAGRLRDWVAGILRWRVPVRWWVVAVGLPLAYAVALHIGLLLFGDGVVDLSLLPVRAGAYLPVLVVTTIAMGGLNEEPGWRGFALPHLQQRFSAMRATLVLGIVWAMWHLPQFAFAEARKGLESPEFGLVIGGTLIEIVAWAFVFTWLYNRTRSTLLCVLLHGGINAAGVSLLLSPGALAGSVYVGMALTGNAIVVAGAVALIVLTGGRLGSR